MVVVKFSVVGPVVNRVSVWGWWVWVWVWVFFVTCSSSYWGTCTTSSTFLDRTDS